MTATVSGSFRRAMGAVQEAVYALTDAGVQVLSPADPRVVDSFGDFLYVASDRLRLIRLVQSRHLAAIAASDFLWLVAPDGYVGTSAALEIGHALGVGTPVYAKTVPGDLTLRQYVRIVDSPVEAVRRSRSPNKPVGNDRPHVLLDPATAIEAGHRDLDAAHALLERSATTAGDLEQATRGIRRLIAPIGPYV